MARTRTQSSIFNFATELAYTAVTLVVGLASTRLILGWLGTERYGALRVTLDWFDYLVLFEFGVGDALLALLNRAVARGDTAGVRDTLGLGVRVYGWTSLIRLTAWAAFITVIGHVVPVASALQNDLRMAAVVGLAIVLVGPLAPFRLLAEASRQGYRVNLLLVTQNLLTVGLSLVAAYREYGITGQLVAVFIGSLPFHLVLAWYGIRQYPGVLGAALGRRPAGNVHPELFQLSSSATVLNICGRVSLLTDNIVIAWLMSPALVVPFFITRRLAQILQSQLQSVGKSSWASLAELHVQGEKELFLRRATELTRIVTVLAVATLVPIAFFNQPFVTLWVGEAKFGGSAVTWLAAAIALLQAIYSFYGWILTGTGHLRDQIPMSIAGAVVNVAFSVILTLRFGIPGPLLGTLVMFAVTGPWWLVLLHRLFDLKPGPQLRAIALPLAVGVPYAALVGWAARFSAPWGLPGVVAEMGASCALYLGAWALFFTSAEERLLWKDRLERLGLKRG